MHTIDISLNIAFTSKWRCGSGEGNLFANRLIRRDSRGWPCIPATTLKGIIRENCERLSRMIGLPEPVNLHQPLISTSKPANARDEILSPIGILFGDPFHEGSLSFRDASVNTSPIYDSFFQSRTRIDRVLNTVKDKALFNTEYAHSKNFAASKFATKIDGYCRNHLCSQPGDIPLAFCLLIVGILCVERIGGDKSTGGGNLEMSFDLITYNGTTISPEDFMDYFEYYQGLIPDMVQQADENRRP